MNNIPPLARTCNGDLQGLRDGTVCAWLGVPYAQPPVGDLRFREAEPARPWHGMREATACGAACPQNVRGSGKSLGTSQSEDCLTLNIWSPAPGPGKRPVMVWIHGGAFMEGSARIYEGAHLAAQGDIVVVTLNYRVGVLGFANFGEALQDPRSPGNLGLRDQIAALRWVRENIFAFGGDPDRVTIAGESAGATSVALLMVATDAKPLFHGAIMQSGSFTMIHDRDASLKLAKLYLELLGAATLAALQALPVAALLAAQTAVKARMPHSFAASPWFDSALMPATVAAARDAPTADVPLLAGFNRDEIRLFARAGGVFEPFFSRPRMAALLQSQLGEAETERVLGPYPPTRQGTLQLGTDLLFAMPTLHFAERHAKRHPTWFYRFDCGNPLIGAAHGLELLYLWEPRGIAYMLMRGAPLLGRRLALATRMRSHWIAFIRDGRPASDWLAFEANRRTTLIFDKLDQLTYDPEHERRVAWAGRDATRGETREAPLPANLS